MSNTCLGEQKLGVKLVDGLDVGEDGGDGVLAEHWVGAVLLVDPEVEHLKRRREPS